MNILIIRREYTVHHHSRARGKKVRYFDTPPKSARFARGSIQEQ